MDSNEIRKKFREFFEKNEHRWVESSSLIPDDPSVLLTTAGMQQFKPYYTGEADPMHTIHPNLGRPLGFKNAASIQKSFRTSDIDEVGDESHLTFFEMLGNFSFGGYFKEEAIRYAYDFFKEIDLPIEHVTVFGGDHEVPPDEESEKIWRGLGIEKIEKRGREDNFWGPTGSEGPCGPTTEIYVGGIEIWNIVFNQYYCHPDKTLTPLKQNGVDTGMGLERLAMVAQGKKNIFETDLFTPIIKKINIRASGRESERAIRIIADHARAIVFLIADGVRPSNKGAGYALRRLMRRVIIHGVEDTLLFDTVVQHYGDFYEELGKNRKEIRDVATDEYIQFSRTLRNGLNELAKLQKVDAKSAFRLYESYGLPYEVIKDFDGGRKAHDLTREDFDKESAHHQEISRAGATAKFGGHGLYLKTGEVTVRDESELEKVTRLHTVTHLLHAGLRAVLGDEVRQDGSDITVERTRFDFRFPQKVTPEELKKVEEWVNDVIKKDLSVKWEEMSYHDALSQGALGFFREKYPERVKVYAVFDPKTEEVYSKELCGGPHVEHTGVIGKFKILKEESSSAGVRRIRAIVE